MTGPLVAITFHTESKNQVATLLTSEWSTLIGRDPRDTVLSLVEPYYDGAKVHAITTHIKASKMPPLEAFYVPFCVVMA